MKKLFYLINLTIFTLWLACDNRTPTTSSTNISEIDRLELTSEFSLFEIEDLDSTYSQQIKAVAISNDATQTGIKITFNKLSGPGIFNGELTITTSDSTERAAITDFDVTPNTESNQWSYNETSVIRAYLTDNASISDTISISYNNAQGGTEAANYIVIEPPYPNEIMIQGGGDTVSTDITAGIFDGNGNLVSQTYQLLFEIKNPIEIEGVYLNQENQTTDTLLSIDGKGTVTIHSGVKPGAVKIGVGLYNENDPISPQTLIAYTEAIPVTIVSGPPAFGEINLSYLDMAYIPGAGAYQVPLSIMLRDIHSNPVADSTNIYFAIRDNATTYNPNLSYLEGSYVIWGPDDAQNILDSLVYECITPSGEIGELGECPLGESNLENSSNWALKPHSATVEGTGKTGMVNPGDGNSYPGMAFNMLYFGSSSIWSEIIIFGQTFTSEGILIIDSRDNHDGNPELLPLTPTDQGVLVSAQPVFYQFQNSADAIEITIAALLYDYAQYPINEGRLFLSAPYGNATYVCGGIDTDIDLVSGYCIDAADGDTLTAFNSCSKCNEAAVNPEVIYYGIIPEWFIDDDDDKFYGLTNSDGMVTWTVEFSADICQEQEGGTFFCPEVNIGVQTLDPQITSNANDLTLIFQREQ